jgi:glycosyltransferase involved in cell wall biosynthesis
VNGLLVVSHTYVEPENRRKLRALAEDGPVTVVVPRRWREGALRREWRLAGDTQDGLVRVVAAPWLGPMRASIGLLRVPGRALRDVGLVQVEEEPWTPTAWRTLARAGSTPVCLFSWENLDRPMPFPWSAWRRRVFGGIAGLLAGSSGAVDVARAQGYAGPAAVIPQLGVDLPPARARHSGPGMNVVFVGRLVGEKGMDLLLRAMSGLPADCRLEIVGDGPEREALERLAGELGLKSTRFLGARAHAEVAAVWESADVLVLPSRAKPSWKEQLGHVLLEAMAHGVAVIGADSGAIPDVIGDAGIIFPENDHAALHRRLAALAADPERRAALGAAGRRRVAALFTNARIAERTRAFHREVLGR